LKKLISLIKISETSGLLDADRFVKLDLESNLKKIIDEENISLRQKARDKFLLDGDENSKYFHLLAKHKKRKLKILTLSHGDILAHDDHGINHLATSFYKELFGPSQDSSISLANVDMKQLEEGDRNLLISPFSLEEIKDVVFTLKHNSAPGPDGFLPNFFRSFGKSLKVICLIFLSPFMTVHLILRDLILG
jgi:hypothetical protein